MMDDKCCGTCKYKYIIHKDSCYMNNVCFNNKSEHCADWIEYSDSCEEWERKRAMKYKVGDKVKVRSDLQDGEIYGCYIFSEGMKKHKGKNVTISFALDGCYDIEEDRGKYTWTDKMFEGLVEDELTAEEAIRFKAEMCETIRCSECKFSKENNGEDIYCNNFIKKYPERVVEVLKQRKKDHEKKEVETEIVDLIRIMKEQGDSLTCKYTYEIDINEEDVDEKMDELVKQYYEENGGKIYAKFERICRLKS